MLDPVVQRGDKSAKIRYPVTLPPVNRVDYLFHWAQSLWYGIPGMVLLFLVGGWVLVRPRPETVADSEPFRTAIRALAPAIREQHATPREMKRFLNMVRYIAMEPRPDTFSIWKCRAIRRANTEDAINPLGREAMLVYLSVFGNADLPGGSASEGAAAAYTAKNLPLPTEDDRREYEQRRRTLGAD